MSTAFTRLVWKEHRAQRQLWLVLLLASVCLYVMMRLQAAPWQTSLATSSIFCVLFVIAATAIAFAGEVDDQTVTFLRMLPCRTSTMMTAKVSAIFTGCLALFLAIATLNGLTEIIGLAFPRVWRTEGFVEPFDSGLLLRSAAIVVVLSIATHAASLLTRRVISAVGLATVLCSAAFMFPPAILILIAATIVLARPWHLGRIPRDWKTPELRTAGTRRASRKLLPQSISLLKRIVARPMSHRRLRSTLMWRECRAAVPFAALWLLIGTVICVGRCVGMGPLEPLPFIFLLVFIHECGQRTMRADQRSRSIALLANMGVSPGAIWLSKTATWLMVMIAVGTGVIFLDSILPYPHSWTPAWGSELRVFDLIARLRTPHVLDHPTRISEATAMDHWLQAAVAVVMILIPFSVGQLTACWIQRQILAFAASLLLLLGMGYWTKICLSRDYSIWLAVVPMGLCFLLATYFTARQWIDRTISWRLRIQQFAWVVVPFILCSTLGWWAWLHDDTDPDGAQERFSGGFYTQHEQTIFKDAIEPLEKALWFPASEWKRFHSTPDAKIWHQFATELDHSPHHKKLLTPRESGWQTDQNSSIPFDVIQSEAPEEVRALLQIFDQHLATKGEWPQLPLSWTAPWSNTPAPSVTYLLLFEAANRQNEGDIAGAVRQYVRAIQLGRALANQTACWKNWTACLASERVALENLRLLLGTADLASVNLPTLYTELRDLLLPEQIDSRENWQTLDPRIMLHRRVRFWSMVAFADATLPHLKELASGAEAFAGTEATFQKLEDQIDEMGSPTLFRAVRTMGLSNAILGIELSRFTAGSRAGVFDPREFSNTISSSNAVQRRAATSTIGDLNEDPTMFSDRLEPAEFPVTINMMAEERATLLTILLQSYRIQHGKFPDSLLDLNEGRPDFWIVMTDPWSGAPFFYAPNGVAMPVRRGHRDDGFRVAAGQPLLYSSGRFGYPIQHYMESPSATDRIPLLPARKDAWDEEIPFATTPSDPPAAELADRPAREAANRPDLDPQDKTTDSVATLPPDVILFIGLDEYSNRDPLHNRVIQYKASEEIPSESATSTDNQ